LGAAYASPMTETAPVLTPTPVATSRRMLGTETLLVLGVSIGASALYALWAITERLTRDQPLSQQTASLNVSRLQDRPWLDLADQLLRISLALVPVFLALYLLSRYPGQPTRLIGLNLRRPWFDLGSGALLALVIGVPGLALIGRAHV